VNQPAPCPADSCGAPRRVRRGSNEVDVTAEQALEPELAVDAEKRGYDAIWFGETSHDPTVSIAMAARATSRVMLGTGVTIALARSPMTLAVTANDLQLVTEGRLMLGLGSQVKAHVTRRFSMPWSQPVGQMREFVLAMRAIWRSWHEGEPLDFQGDYYSHTLMTPFFNPGPNPYGPPPVLLAGVGAKMTGVAGEVADGFMCHGFTTERYLREVVVPSLRAGRERSGRDLDGFEISGLPFVVTGTTEEEVAASAAGVRDQIAFYAATPAYRPVLELHGWGDLQTELNAMTKAGRWKEMGSLLDDEMLNTFAIVAEPDRVAEEVLRRFRGVFTRMHLYLKAELDADVQASIREQIQAGA
jgi:probable F420-dependent oxidoreductase